MAHTFKVGDRVKCGTATSCPSPASTPDKLLGTVSSVDGRGNIQVQFDDPLAYYRNSRQTVSSYWFKPDQLWLIGDSKNPFKGKGIDFLKITRGLVTGG